MAEVIQFTPRPKLDPIQLTIVYDDIALFCDKARDALRPIAHPHTRLEAITLSSTVNQIASGPAAIRGRTTDYMLPLGQDIARHADAMLNLMAIHFKSGDMARIAQDVFALPPLKTPGAEPLTLQQKCAVLHAFGANRLAALLK